MRTMSQSCERVFEPEDYDENKLYLAVTGESAKDVYLLHTIYHHHKCLSDFAWINIASSSFFANGYHKTAIEALESVQGDKWYKVYEFDNAKEMFAFLNNQFFG